MVIYLKSFLYLIVFCLISSGLHAQTTVMHDSAYVWNYYYQNDDEVVLKLHYRSIDIQYHNNEMISQTGQSYDGENWFNSMKYTYQYNPKMSVTSELIQRWIDGAWTNYTHRIKEYDSDNNETVSISLEWKNGAWVNNYKHVTEWIQNHKTSEVSFQWDGDSWRNSHKDVYTYTTHGDLKSTGSFSWNGVVWENISRSYYYYDEKFREIERIDQNWYNEIWNNESQAITSYDSGLNILSVYFNGWSNSEWVEDNRAIMEYDVSNQMTSIYQQKQGGDWVNDSRSGFVKYAEYWMMRSVDEWRDAQWHPIRELNYYLNSENQLYARAMRSWTGKFDENPGILTSWDSTVWYASDNVGEEELLRELEIFAYPNPSNGTLRILTDVKPTTLYIYNTAGNLVRRMENISGGIIDIDLIDEPRGMYFINCCSGNDSKTVKVLLE